MIAVKNKAQVSWQLQSAKAQFSRVVRCAVENGPQLVTKGGEPAVYVVSAKLFDDELARSVQNRKRILLASPQPDTVLDLVREQEDGREVEL